MKVTITIMMVLFVLAVLFVSPLEGQIIETPLSTPVILPQWADGLGWSSEIVVTNFDTMTPTTVQAEFHQSSGSSFAVSAVTDPNNRLKSNVNGTVLADLPAGGRTTIRTLGNSSVLMSGWIKLTAGTKIGAQLKYHYPYGSDEQVTTVLPCALRRGSTVSVDFVKTGTAPSTSTGIAFANPNASATYVDLTLVDNAGVIMNSTPKRIILPPNGHLARFFHEAELFADFLANRSEFHGSIQVVAGSPIGVMSVGFNFKPDGKYLMDNAPALPPTYRGAVALLPTTRGGADTVRRAVQAVVFVPRDVAVDPDYVSGMRFVAGEVMSWYDAEFARSGQEDLSSTVDFVRDQDGRVRVDLVIGDQTQAYYQALPYYYPDMTIQLQSRYGNTWLFVSHQINPDVTGGFGGAGWMAVFSGPRKLTIPSEPKLSYTNSWKSFSESYLRSPEDPPSPATFSFTKYENVTSLVETATHEFGHMLALPHSYVLSTTYPGRYANIMASQKENVMGFGIFKGTTMQDINLYGNPGVNSALDRTEVETILAFLSR